MKRSATAVLIGAVVLALIVAMSVYTIDQRKAAIKFQLCEVVDRGRVRAEIWERGAGYTLASGTSASAVAAACMRRGVVNDRITVSMPGGELAIRRESSGNLFQTGPARRVYRATVELGDFS